MDEEFDSSEIMQALQSLSISETKDKIPVLQRAFEYKRRLEQAENSNQADDALNLAQQLDQAHLSSEKYPQIVIKDEHAGIQYTWEGNHPQTETERKNELYQKALDYKREKERQEQLSMENDENNQF